MAPPARALPPSSLRAVRTVTRRLAGRVRKAYRRRVRRPYRRLKREGRDVRRRAVRLRGRRQAERELARIASGSGPIVVGPYASEMAFEILYWIPMLNWWAERYGVDRERVTVISRGGADPWYGDLGSTYLDIFDYCPPDALKAAVDRSIEATRSSKQTEVSSFDREVLRRAGPDLGTDDYTLLHPRLMWQLLTRSFTMLGRGALPLSTVLERSAYRPLPTPGPSSAVDGLPDGYVAVKLYFSGNLPDTEAHRRFFATLIARLAERTHVVVLSSGVDIDEHEPWLPGGGARVHYPRGLTPRNNLALQTELIAGARALFTTFGGFAYMAAFLDVPAYALLGAPRDYNAVHDDVLARAERALRQQGRHPRVVPLSIEDAGALDVLVGAGGAATLASPEDPAPVDR